MGFEYRGVARAGAALPWSTICEVIEAFAEVEIVARDGESVAFNFPGVVRDRTIWTEDGSLHRESDGSLYVIFHVGPQRAFVTRLERSLAEVGVLVDLREL